MVMFGGVAVACLQRDVQGDEFEFFLGQIAQLLEARVPLHADGDIRKARVFRNEGARVAKNADRAPVRDAEPSARKRDSERLRGKGGEFVGAEGNLRGTASSWFS